MGIVTHYSRVKFFPFWVIFILLVFFALSGEAQPLSYTWARSAGAGSEQEAQAVTADLSGNVYVTGYIKGNTNFSSISANSAGGEDIFIAKYDLDGNIVWAKPAGGTGDDRGTSIAVDNAGNIYVCGYIENGATFFGSPSVVVTGTGVDVFVAKYNSSGNVLWAKRENSTSDGAALGICTNGTDVFVTGEFAATISFGALPVLNTSGMHDAFIASFNASTGAENWAIKAGSSSDDFGEEIAVDATGIYISGSYDATITFQNMTGTLTNSGNSDVFVLKYNLSGTGIWKRKAGGSGDDHETSVCVSGPYVYLGGHFSSTMNMFDTGPVVASVTAASGDDGFIAQYDVTTGNFAWVRSENGTGNEKVLGISANPAGEVFLTGNFTGSLPFGTGPAVTASAEDIFVTKYNSSGIFQWGKKVAGNGDDYGRGIVAPDNTSVYVVGGFKSTPANFDAQAISTVSNFDIFTAKLGCTVTVSTAGPDQSLCLSSVATLDANMPITGTGVWSVISGGGTITTPANPTSTVSGLTVGANVFQWTITNSVCPSSTFDQVTITIDAQPTIANAGPDQSICASTGTFAGNAPLIGNGAWTFISGTGAATTPSSPTSGFTGITTGSSVFQWTITNGVCPASSDLVTITRDPNPTTANAGSDQTVCSASAIFAGNNPTTGTGVWTLVTGTGTISNPNSPTSPVNGLSTGINTFRWTISNGSCPSSSDLININVDPVPTTSNAGSDQTVCSASATFAGNVPSTGTGTWTLISGTGTIAIPGSATSTVSGLSVGANVFRWTITSGVCAASFDEVIITRNATPTTSNAGPDQSVCTTTATLAGNNPATGTGTWTLVSGTGVIATPSLNSSTVNGLSPGANVFQWTISNGVCPSSSDQVTINVDPFPTVSNAGPDQNICSSAATLAGNTPTNGTGFWTLVSGTGTITNATSPTSGVTGLSVGANVFRWTITSGTCSSSADNVTITRDPNPTTANAGTDQTLCTSTTTLAGNAPAIGTGVWTLISGSGNITIPSANNSGVTGLVTGTAVFQWTISNGTCPSSSDQVTINHDANPTLANAGPDQTACSSSATFAGNIPSTGTGFWTLISGTGVITSPAVNNSSVTGLSVGANVFQWTISNGTCPSTSDQVTLTRDPDPTTADAGVDQTICSSTTSLAGNNPVIGTGVWTLISGTGTLVTPGSPTSSVNGLSLGANVFRWTISNGTCTASFDEVTITRDANPTIANAGIDQTLCTSTATLAGNGPVTGTAVWTLVSGTGTITTPSSPTSGITGLSVGANVFRWTISNGTCPSTNDLVTITQDPNPTIANAGTDQTLCTSSTTLAGNAPSIGTGTWTLISGNGNITTPSANNSGVTGLTTGAAVFQWTISNGTCPSSSDQVTINLDANPTVANAGPDQTACSSSATLAGNVPSTGSGSWTLVSGTGTVTFPSLNNSTVTGLSIGANVFQWTISNGTCPSTSDQVTLTRDPDPTTSNAGLDQTICSSTTSLAGNSPAIGTGTWTLISGTGTIVTPTSPTSSVNGLSLGTNVFRWTISNGTCAASFDEVTINVDENPTVALAGSDQTLCSSAATLAGNAPTTGTAVWTLISGSGTITTPSSPISGITGLSVGANIFQWTISNGTCPSTSDQVTFNRDQNPTTANAGGDQTICSATVSLAGNTPAIGNGTWTLISGTGTIVSPTSANSVVNGLSVGANVFRWTITNGTCVASFDEVTINVDANPSTAAAGPDQTLCTSTTTLAATIPLTGNGTWTVISGTGILTTPSSSSSGVTGLSTGSTVFQWTVTNGTCPASTDQVTVFHDADPTPANAGSDQTICTSNTSLVGNTPSIGTGVWTLISGTGTLVSPSSPNSTVNGLSLGANIFQWTTSNGTCASSSDQVTINVDPNPTISNAGTDQVICSPASSLAGNIPATGSGVWNLISGTGIIATPSSPSSAVTGLSVGANVFQWSISNGTCPSSADQVIINVDAFPTTANAGADQAVCSASTTLNGNAAVSGTGTWHLVSGTGVIVTPNSPVSAVNGLSVGANIFRWEIINGTCAASNDTVLIYRDPSPTVANAGADQTICSGTATLTGTAPVTGSGSWSLVSGTGNITSSSSSVTTVTGLSPGANVFSWEIANGTCPSSTDLVTINVDANPTLANAGVDQTICSSSSSFAGNIPLTGNGIWSVISGPGIIANASQPSSAVANLATGLNVFEWTISNGVCPSSHDTVSILIDQFPTVANAGQDQQICSSLSAMNGNVPVVGTGTWLVVSSSGNFTNAALPNTGVTNLVTGINTFEWVIANGTCPASRDTVSILVDDLPSTANAGADQLICSSGSVLQGNAPAVGTGNWNVLNGSALVANPLLPNSAVTSLSPGQNSFQWIVTNGVCPVSIDTVIIAVDSMPSNANAGVSQIICSATSSLNAVVPNTGSGQWYVITGGSSLANASQASTAVNALSTGVNSFEWVVSNGVCTSSRDTITITVDENPTTAYAGIDALICDPFDTLTGNIPLVGSGTWYSIGGPSTIGNPLAPITNVTSLVAGWNNFEWVISNGTCPAARDTVGIFYTPRPSAPDAGADIYVCAHDAFMQAEAPTVGTGYWTNLTNTGSFADPADPVSALNNLPDGSYLYTWTTSNAYCTSRADTVVVNVYSPPSLAEAGDDQLVHTTFATLNAVPCDTGFGTWSFVSGSGEIENINDPASRVTNLAVGINILRWTTSNGVCVQTADDMQIESKTLVIPTGYSPNADGTNDNFVIEGLLEYNNVSLEVFNRWGNQVYIASDYKNDWNGAGTNGEVLPDDIYYYVMKLEDGTVFTGYVSLKQKTL